MGNNFIIENNQDKIEDERIYVINMKTNPYRFKHMKKNLDNINVINWNLFEAINGPKLKYDNCKQIIDKEYYDKAFNEKKRESQVSHSKGSIGCFMSHYGIWEKIIQDNNYNWFIIMEDDISIPKDFHQKVLKIIKDTNFGNNQDVGYISLGYIGNLDIKSAYPKEFYKLHLNTYYSKFVNGKELIYNLNGKGSILMNKEFTGAGCYLISKDFAKKLVEKVKKYRGNIQLDSWLSCLRSRGYPIWHTSSPIVNLSLIYIKSDIKHTVVK